MADLVAEKKAKWIKTAKWIYWTVTLLFVVAMMSAGLTFLASASFNVEGVTHLGYPVCLLKFWESPNSSAARLSCNGRFPALKKWAYAGYTFNLIGASASHAFSGDPLVKVLAPNIILALVQVSYRQWKTGWM